jgi:hypothetical protein
MSEEGWLTCRDPEPMLEYLRGKASDRKLRLFAVACCRRVSSLLVHQISREAVEVAERYADGLATEDERDNAHQAADDVWALLPHAFEEGLFEDDPSFANAITAAGIPPYAAEEAAEAPVAALEPSGEEDAVAGAYLSAAKAVGWVNATDDSHDADAEASERAAQADLLRDIFGNPFRPLPAGPFPAEVRALAEACYAALPAQSAELAVLADALADLGEEGAAAHLQEGDHVKGCHVLDWVLGRG